MTPENDPAADAALAAVLFAVDPAGLGGIAVRGRAGPARDAWLAALRDGLPAAVPLGRLPPGVTDDRLLGGLDLSASLAAGRPVVERGVLAGCDGGVVVAPMAERMEEATASRITAVLDAQAVAIEREGLTARLPARVGLVLLDEGAEPEERPPAGLLDRLAFRIDLAGVGRRDPTPPPPDPSAILVARAWLGEVAPAPDDLVEALCAAAEALGIGSIRAPLLALRAARAHAALHGRGAVIPQDAAVAARLVLAPRAVTLPADEAAEPPAGGDDAATPDAADTETQNAGDVADLRISAARALLPEQLLERIVAANLRAARTPRRGGEGDRARSARRGRPLGLRAGRLRPGDRLDLPATLRAAAPWQGLRAAGGAAADLRIRVRPEDFRVRRFVQRRESTTIFVVDASGSSARQRLAEAKGAVELLLAKAYVGRARVALVAFRGEGAEALLAPTRSLTRAKRSLAELPGGGGTPLAAGLDAALALALAERARDRTPLLVVLTDGRANVGRDGAGGRAGAERDAMAAAARIGEARIGGAFLDTSPRPQPGGDRYARAMNAVYAPLPYADAARVSAAVAGLRGGA